MNSLLPATWEIPEIFRQRLGTSVGRQRAMHEEGHLLIVLHAPPKPDQLTREGCFFWRDTDGNWKSTLKGIGTKSLEKHIQNYQDRLEECEQRDEMAKTSLDYFQVLEELSPIQRSSNNMYHVLQEARKMVPEDREIINLRDRCYELSRTVELLFKSAKNALDFLVAKQSEAQSQSSHQMAVSAHRLNILASLFFPMVTLAAIFSTNYDSGITKTIDGPTLWMGLVAGGLALGFVLTLLLNRTSKR